VASNPFTTLVPLILTLLQVSLKLPQAPPCFTDVLVLKGASIGWGDKPAEGAGSPLLSNLELVIKKKQRVLVLGPNGGCRLLRFITWLAMDD